MARPDDHLLQRCAYQHIGRATGRSDRSEPRCVIPVVAGCASFLATELSNSVSEFLVGRERVLHVGPMASSHPEDSRRLR